MARPFPLWHVQGGPIRGVRRASSPLESEARVTFDLARVIVQRHAELAHLADRVATRLRELRMRATWRFSSPARASGRHRGTRLLQQHLGFALGQFDGEVQLSGYVSFSASSRPAAPAAAGVICLLSFVGFFEGRIELRQDPTSSGSNKTETGGFQREPPLPHSSLPRIGVV